MRKERCRGNSSDGDKILYHSWFKHSDIPLNLAHAVEKVTVELIFRPFTNKSGGEYEEWSDQVWDPTNPSKFDIFRHYAGGITYA